MLSTIALQTVQQGVPIMNAMSQQARKMVRSVYFRRTDCSMSGWGESLKSTTEVPDKTHDIPYQLSACFIEL